MTASAGALVRDAVKWEEVDWNHVRREVRRLQMRIAKSRSVNGWGSPQGSPFEMLEPI